MNKLKVIQRDLRLRQVSSCWWLVFALFLFLTPAVATAEADPSKAPADSHSKRYGGGWECERSYRRSSSACELFTVPANAHLGYSGNDWTCNLGYRALGDACIPEKA